MPSLVFPLFPWLLVGCVAHGLCRVAHGLCPGPFSSVLEASGHDNLHLNGSLQHVNTAGTRFQAHAFQCPRSVSVTRLLSSGSLLRLQHGGTQMLTPTPPTRGRALVDSFAAKTEQQGLRDLSAEEVMCGPLL